jgi:superoxide dismutase
MDVAEVKGTPVLGLDVWEHAYYLKYQTAARSRFHFWNVVAGQEWLNCMHNQIFYLLLIKGCLNY